MTQCIPCDLAVSVSLLTNCISDKDIIPVLRKMFLHGELTLADIMSHVDINDESCTYIMEEIKDKWRPISPTFNISLPPEARQ